MLHGILPWHGHGILKINQIIRKKTKKQTKKTKKTNKKTSNATILLNNMPGPKSGILKLQRESLV